MSMTASIATAMRENLHAKAGFVKMTPNGEFDFDSTREWLIKALSIESKASELEILFDFRHARAELTTTNIWYLAAEMDKHRALFKEKIAILIRPDGNFDNAKFFELCATNRGLDVAAFKSYEEAIGWLFPSSDVESRDDDG